MRSAVTVFIVFLFSMVSMPSVCWPFEEGYRETLHNETNTEVVRTLARAEVRVCGDYRYRESENREDDFLVYCTPDGISWFAFRVLTSIEKVFSLGDVPEPE